MADEQRFIAIPIEDRPALATHFGPETEDYQASWYVCWNGVWRCWVVRMDINMAEQLGLDINNPETWHDTSRVEDDGVESLIKLPLEDGENSWLNTPA